MHKLFILTLCLVCSLSYFNSLNNNFVFDDKALIVYNPLVKSIKLLPLVFKKDIYAYFRIDKVSSFDIMYRPMQLFTYWVDYRVWGLNPLGFHLTNILLHLFNSILIYYLLLKISDNKKISGISSILFLIHPIHTSAVSYIAGRADLLSCFFILLSTILYIRGQKTAPFRVWMNNGRSVFRSKKPRAEARGASFLRFIKLKIRIYLGLSLLSAAFALFSRENALILFVFIALILFIHKAKIRNYWFLAYFILLDLFYLLLRFLVFGKAGISTHPAILSFPLRLINFFNIILRYISLLLLPTGLHLLRVTPFIKGLLDVKTLPALLLILLYILLIIRFRKNKLLIFGMLWFLIGLIPVFSYLDGYPKLNGAMMAESWVYVSSIGFFVLPAYILSSLKKLSRIVIVSLVVFYCILTIANNMYWKNDLLVHKRIVDYNPGRNPIRRDLIDDYLFFGLYEDALAEIKKYASYDPDSPDLDIIWGNYYFFTDNLDLAIAKYNMALKRNRHFFIYYRLSTCYKRTGESDKAIELGLKSFKINPYFVLNLIQLGDLYQQKQQLGLAKRYYQLAYTLNPHNKALRDLIKNIE